MEELMIAYDMLNSIAPAMNKLDKTAFGAVYCMIAEEWCRANDEDVEVLMSNICDTVHLVNEECGKY